MANSYLQFSALIPCATKEQKQWLAAKLDEQAESDDGPVCSYEIESDGVWAYAEEYGDPGRLAEIVATYQQQFDRQDGWVLSWAQTCSKMRLGEFTGGAVAVCRGTTHFVVPDSIAREWTIRQQSKRGA